MPNAFETLTAKYPSVLSLPVVWGDMDAFQHVNNTTSIRWFESSRIRFMEEIELTSLLREQGVAPILAAVSCNYRQQLRYPDTVHVGTCVSRLGNTSVTLEHCVVSERLDGIASEGTSVVVCFDYKTQRPVRISDEVRQLVERYR